MYHVGGRFIDVSYGIMRLRRGPLTRRYNPVQPFAQSTDCLVVPSSDLTVWLPLVLGRIGCNLLPHPYGYLV